MCLCLQRCTAMNCRKLVATLGCVRKTCRETFHLRHLFFATLRAHLRCGFSSTQTAAESETAVAGAVAGAGGPGAGVIQTTSVGTSAVAEP